MAQEDSYTQVYALIFDSDILIWMHRGHPGAAQFVNRVPIEGRNLSAISYLELLYGIRDSSDLRAVRTIVADLFAEIVPISETISGLAIHVLESYILAHGLDVSDAVIAATALDRHETLATGNGKHFRFIPGLDLKIFRP
ncbi:MAG: type II toxin-antitoxin system VapC family toxin [Terriglobia bacterium]